MSAQQYPMPAEVAKALAELSETHKYLAPMVHRLFTHWKLSDDEQLSLLGRLPGNIAAGLSNGDPDAHGTDHEIVERIGHLLAVHQHLRNLFPQDPTWAYRWMTSANNAFNGQTPVAVVRDQGVSGLLMLRAYLDHMRGI